MVTLILGILDASQFQQVLGIVLTVLEVLIVVFTLVSFFVPPETKFGKFLSHFLKGLYKGQSYIQDITKQEEKKWILSLDPQRNAALTQFHWEKSC
jgi:hypothetical protein